MENRIDRLFREKGGDILSIYTTAGYPLRDDTAGIVLALQQHGADMIEIGIPFSDPLADGPVIQHSSQVALENGINLKYLFSQLHHIREKVHIPLVLMGYLNPLLQFGMEEFLKYCKDTGIDGTIIPDLPLDEYETRYIDLFNKYGVHLSLLITPHTSSDRIERIAGLSGGFIYMVANASTTGAKESIGKNQIAYFRRIKQMDLPRPTLIGFGISNHETFTTACKYASGAIIGSAFIRMLGAKGSLDQKIGNFIHSIRKDPAGNHS